MARYNRVKINTTYLTSDGLEGSSRCRVTIPNLSKLRIAPRNVEEDLDGGQHVQYSDLRGFEIPMNLSFQTKTALDALIAEINTVEETTPMHNIVIDEGVMGNFDLDCALVSIGDDGRFSNEVTNSVDLVFRVDTMNEYVEPGP